MPGGPGAGPGERRVMGFKVDFEIDAGLVAVLAGMVAMENERQRKEKRWIYTFKFYDRWVLVSRRPWVLGNQEPEYVVKIDTRTTREALSDAIVALSRAIKE